MGWRDLLQDPEEYIVAPWAGGRSLQARGRFWHIHGALPHDHGWYRFKVKGRDAYISRLCEPQPDELLDPIRGYLVGDRLVEDDEYGLVYTVESVIYRQQVHLLDPGLGRFVRISAGRTGSQAPLVFQQLEMPLGPEDDVLKAYEDRLKSVDHIKGISPALDLAFRLETFQRDEVERQRREEQERREKEERRRQLVEKLGDGAGRREMAKIDFTEAAKAALLMGDAEYLDHRKAANKGEFVVRFRLDGRRFECVCSEDLHIIDSGICLTAHGDDEEFEAGTKGDTFFSLESLPAVIREAIREGKLVQYRHVD